jgi:GDP/UDP-N,N'-diacetylbacillosamine 2-epimerase (hydrolysing)
MLNILIITGSRGEYGYIRPIIKYINTLKDVNYKTVITNMHLCSKFGDTINEFHKDKITTDYKIYNTLDSYNNSTMAKSLGIFLMQIPEIILASQCNMILISGDRGEQLMSAIAASHLNIPVAHIQAGEKSGNIDGQIRHSITKISHLHFCSNIDAYNRVINLGEERFRIFNTGAPLIDELIDPNFYLDDIEGELNIPKNKDIMLIVNHPISEESDKADEQMNAIFCAIEKYDNFSKIIIMPNSDSGSLKTRQIIHNNSKKNNHYIFFNLTRKLYISIMRKAKLMIGNSSSGIMEAPTFKLPVVNIGRRQIGRFRGKNVIDVNEYNIEKIKSSIDDALSDKFRKSLINTSNPYGDSSASKKIVDTLRNIKIDNNLLNKNITY